MSSPEELAREKIDALLQQCGWILQSRSTINLSATAYWLERRSGPRLSLALHEMSAKQGSHWNLQSQLLRRSARCPGASRIPGKTKASSAVHGLSPTRSDR